MSKMLMKFQDMLNLAKPQRKKKTQRKRKKGAGSCLDQDI